ncbi:MAG: hypothetical protein WCY36_02740 [Candidatus Omnitrophota bacterium]
MKLFWAGLLVLLSASFCYAGGASVYKYDDLKFLIECPQNYEVKRMSGAYQNTVGIVLSGSADKRSFKPNVTISSAPNSNPPISLDRFFNLNLQNFLKDANFKIVLAEKTKLGSKEVYQLRYKQKVAPKEGSKDKEVVAIEVLQVYVIESTRVYVINYSATASDFETYLAPANEIFKSFKAI